MAHAGIREKIPNETTPSGIDRGAFASFGVYDRGADGETEQQIETRSGKPVLLLSDHGGFRTRQYSFQDFKVTVTFEKGVSQCELYEKPDK